MRSAHHITTIICMNKLVIKQKFPDSMHELVATMSYNIPLLHSPFLMELGCEVLERIRKRGDVRDVLQAPEFGRERKYFKRFPRSM